MVRQLLGSGVTDFVGRCRTLVHVLDWDGLDPHRMERVVQVLLRDAFGATAIDGSGGDLAQDARWESPEGLVIFEVKSFSKRLNTSQKRQVKRSLLRAVELHSPVRWVLITRSLPSPSELAWLQGLSVSVPGAALEWWGRDWLDLRLADREDLISYIEGADYKLLKRSQQLSMERAALATGDDLSARLDRLLDQGDSLSPYWRWEFSTGSRGRMKTLTPKRPESHLDDPISISPTFHFPPDDPEAREIAKQLQETLQVGGDVAIPGRYVQRFEVTAASEATQRLLGNHEDGPGDLEIISVPDSRGLPMRSSLVLQSSAAERHGLTVPVTFTRRVGGSDGITLHGSDDSGVLSLRLVLRGSGTIKGRLNVTLQPVAGRRPHEVLPVLQLLASVRPGDTLAHYAGPAELGTFSADEAWPDNLEPLCRLVAALEMIQRHVKTIIPIPAEDLPADAVRDLLNVADALSGQRVALPYGTLTATVRPGALPGFLEDIPVAGGALYISHSAEFILDGRTYVVPGIATWAPRVRLANRERLATERNNNVEHPAEFEPIDGEHWYLIRAVEDGGYAKPGLASAS